MRVILPEKPCPAFQFLFNIIFYIKLPPQFHMWNYKLRLKFRANIEE